MSASAAPRPSFWSRLISHLLRGARATQAAATRAATSEPARLAGVAAMDALALRYGSTILDPARAQALSARLSLVLDSVIAVCAAELRSLAGPRVPWQRSHLVALPLAAQKLAGITAQLEAILAEFPATAAVSPASALPAPSPTSAPVPSSSAVRNASPLDRARFVYRYALAASHQIVSGLRGPNGSSVFAVRAAMGELAALLAYLREAQGFI